MNIRLAELFTRLRHFAWKRSFLFTVIYLSHYILFLFYLLSLTYNTVSHKCF